MSQSLFQEAIADAKQLREVAEQNAKNAIVEAVTPKIREFIDKQLVGDESYATDDDLLGQSVSSMTESSDEDVVLSNDALETLLSLATGDDSLSELNHARSRGIVASALKESLDIMPQSDREKLLIIAEKLKNQTNSLGSSDIVMNEDNHLFSKETQSMSRNDEILYEVDLNELVSGLSVLSEGKHEGDGLEEGPYDEPVEGSYLDEEDLDEAGHMEGSYLDEEDLDEADLDELDVIIKGLPDEARDMIDLSQLSLEFLEDEEGEEGEEGAEGEEGLEGMEFGEEEGAEGGEEEEGGDEEPLEEVFEVDLDMLKREISRLAEGAGLITMGKKNKMAHAFGGKPSDHPSGESFGGGKRTKDPHNVKIRDAVKLAEAYENERRRNRSLKGKLEEYGSAVHSLREQLTEMNLFNAKLLYVNKLLQNKDVSSSQRRAIIEALDSANSLREVKLLYRSLTESVRNSNGRTGRLSESTVRRSLGSSRVLAGSSPSTDRITEVDRWAVLAGIKND